MCRTLTAREFIQETLIKEFADIVNGEKEHNYISFLLISCGIEFLGKCMAPVGTDWHHRASEQYFKQGVSLFPDPYKQQDIDDVLYHGLRCGICHALLPKNELIVSSTEEQDLNGNPLHLNIHTFYNDFKQACTTLLENENYKARLEESFMATSENSSGSPKTIKIVKQE